MAQITIFGSGNMGQAIGGVLTDGGNQVTHIDTERFGSARIEGDIVILAVPYAAVSDIITTYRDQLTGRTVVDITNPLDFSTFDSLVVPTGSSAAAEIATQLPESRVLKAFNTNFAATLATSKVGELSTTVLIAGNDSGAKDSLKTAVEAGGKISAIDAGSLDRAHELEAVGFLQLTLAASEKIGWTGGFGVVR